ncbi:MAG: glycosyltransferase family 4 protein, partial [Odoribacter sp.]
MINKITGKQIIVFEDSSKAGFGGGQKITLLVSDILSKDHPLHFVDFTETSRYMQLVRDKHPLSKVTILHSKVFPNTMKLLSRILEVVCFLIFWKVNVMKLRREFEMEKCVIYATTKKALLFACYLNRKYNTPYIYHAHLVENTNSFFNRYLLSYLKKAECIFCVSKVVFDSIPLDNKMLLYNPNQNNKGFKGEKTNKKFVIAVVGSLIEIKGFEYFVLAALDSSPEIEFRIYGEGYLESSLKMLAHNRVKFMGFCSDIISEMYSSIDLIVVPTIIREALPLVLVEAKSVGLPVITTNIGGQAEIVVDTVDG